MSNSEFTKKIRIYRKRVEALNSNDLNEADTVFHFGHFLSNVLGYDRMTDITREFAIRSTYCDYAVRINNKLQFLIEVKAMPVSLKESHLRQAASYAMNSGIEWCLLTNGIEFQLYHIEFTKPIDTNLVFIINILTDDIKRAAKNLHYLTKTSFKKKEIITYWNQISSLSDTNLAKALLSEDVLKTVRRVIKKNTGYNIDLMKIGHTIRDLFDDSLNIKISAKKVSKRKLQAKKESSSPISSIDEKDTSIPTNIIKNEDN